MKRAEILRELTELTSPEELARLLPEDPASVRQSLALLDLNLEELLADLQREAGPGNGLRAISFAVTHEDETVIEEAVQAAAAGLQGTNRRGRAIALIARRYLDRS